jgi:hypothetical protein
MEKGNKSGVNIHQAAKWCFHALCLFMFAHLWLHGISWRYYNWLLQGISYWGCTMINRVSNILSWWSSIKYSSSLALNLLIELSRIVRSSDFGPSRFGKVAARSREMVYIQRRKGPKTLSHPLRVRRGCFRIILTPLGPLSARNCNRLPYLLPRFL